MPIPLYEKFLHMKGERNTMPFIHFLLDLLSSNKDEIRIIHTLGFGRPEICCLQYNCIRLSYVQTKTKCS